jgi:hypothetical protein
MCNYIAWGDTELLIHGEQSLENGNTFADATLIHLFNLVEGESMVQAQP